MIRNEKTTVLRENQMVIAGMTRVAAAVMLLMGSAALSAEEGEIRGLKVGVVATSLPTEGLAEFACAATGAPLAGWADYATCPADAAGLHEIAVQYDQADQQWAPVNDTWEGTKLAGHPVILTTLIGDDGMVQAIRAVTDPEAPPYLRKKAFLLYIRVMGQYGRDGWTCVEKEPGDREPVGGQFIDRRCEKELPGRRLVVQTDLYRAPGQTGKTYTDRTVFEIWRSAG
jgi:hypothetical protein